MSHQSGITGTDELTQTFSELYNSESTRLIKVVIQDEKLVVEKTYESSGDFENDWDQTVLDAVDEDAPCYLLYRLDSKNASGNDFVFIAWSPDFAHIRQKMLYASTRATFKQSFGSNYIKDEIFGTVADDVSFAGYQKHLTAAAAPPPMTDEEIEKKEIRAAETGVEIGASTKHAVATGVSFPVSEAAVAKLKDLKAGKLTYVQLSLDTDKEVINLEKAKDATAETVAAEIPDDTARYHVFNFRHNHEGDNLESLVFIYSCPGYKCSVKERMLYSTCKGPLVDVLEQDLGLTLEKKLEIGESSEFSKDYVYDQLHPAKVVFKQQFKRPARPGRGTRRLIRGNKE